MTHIVDAILAALLAAAVADGAADIAYDAADAHLNRSPADEIIYFVLPDRFENGDPGNDLGGYAGGATDHGFDPRHKGFYHGGDLSGLTAQLDYIQALGASAIWLGPIYKNKPVQGAPGEESAGYHGYWITDFTAVDPHFGDESDLRAFIDAAHGRGMKVYFDIITNHTADIISYRECYDPDYAGDDKQEAGCPYRRKGDFPFTTRGDVDGDAINDGFLGVSAEFQTMENFERLARADYAYTPFIPAGQERVKKPSWLNNPIYYHNRGETTFEGENSRFGDFFGLDDLQTEDPRVVAGFIDIYKDWIEKYKIDGFRIDTARHVNPEFWVAFAPAMIESARAVGTPNFFIFGEVYDPDPAALARATRVDALPSVLDFAFQAVVEDVVAEGAPTAAFDTLFAADALYKDGASTASSLPLFLGNHDMGRIGTFLRKALPVAGDAELVKRSTLAHAMMFFMRGAPVIYYGDEQGFVGDGGDQAAREDMFPSRVASYNDNRNIGTDASAAASNFDQTHPLFLAIQRMATIYKAHPTLRRGAQVVRKTELDGGLVAVSRVAADAHEYMIAFNTRDEAYAGAVEVDPRSRAWSSVHGACNAASAAVGAVEVELRPLEFMICRSNEWVDPK